MDYQEHRFGSAQTADLHTLKRAGLLDGRGVSFGFDESQKYELRVPTDGSIALFGGAGSGKSASLYANNLIGGHFQNNFLSSDPRGELAMIAILAMSLQGYSLYFANHTGMHGLPQHRFNPLDHLTLDSPSLIADVQKFALDAVSTPSGTKNSWPYEDARRWLGDLALYDAEINGVASLPTLFHLIMCIQGNIDKWCDHLDRMSTSRFPSVQTFAGEIMAVQREGRESFTAPYSTLQSAFAYMRDPRLQEMFSGGDFSMRWLSDPTRKMAVFVIFPIEYLQTQAPAVRSIIGSAIQYKLRNPQGQSVSIFVDEAGQLGYFPSIRELVTFGRGAGLINNILAWQEISQIKSAFGAEANEIIGSAQFRVFKGVRTIETANLVSQMSGTMTLDFDNTLEQSNAQRMKRHAVQQLLSGQDFISAAADIKHYQQASQHQNKQARAVLTPDEALNMRPTQMVAFASGLVEAPIIGHWINHFDRRDFAGKYLNNPYHGELVRIKTRWGHEHRRVIEAPVPDALGHLPQFESGTFRYVDGYRPNI